MASRDTVGEAQEEQVMLVLINSETGLEPTATELLAITERANEILRSPHSAPEQIEWAMMIPGATIELYWESAREQAQRRK